MLQTESKKPAQPPPKVQDKPIKLITPTKIITVLINSHGADLVVPAFIIPLNVRILSAAGIPGCYNFGKPHQRIDQLELTTSRLLSEREKTDFTTYKVLEELRAEFLYEEQVKGYEHLNEAMDRHVGRAATTNIPVEGDSAVLAKSRTENAIYSSKRFKLIKPVADHKYIFERKNEAGGAITDGIYVIDSMNNPDSGLKFGDNLAENIFDINDRSAKTGTIPSSIHDITPTRINYVRRKFGPYLSLAKLYCDGDNLEAFKNKEEVSKWVTDNYSPVDNIYRLGCMKLFETPGTNKIELKALMCATLLGEKFAAPKPGDKWEREIFPAILEKFNKLTAEIKPKFITGLTPAEFDKILAKYNVSSNPSFVGTVWDSMHKDLIQVYTNPIGGIKNTMSVIPVQSRFDSENIEDTSLIQLIKYLKGLGYDGINILDFSCRVNKTSTEPEMLEQEEKETLSPRTPNTNWGGLKFRKTQSKRRLKKSKVKRKKSKRRKAI